MTKTLFSTQQEQSRLTPQPRHASKTFLAPPRAAPLGIALRRALGWRGRQAPLAAATLCAVGLFSVAAPLHAAVPTFVEHVVSTNAFNPISVASVDVDGDGDIDLLSAFFFDDKIAWYENDGNGNFTEHVVSTNVDLAESVSSADVDGDGDIDLLSASSDDDKIAWYENDGNTNFTEHVVSTNADGAFSVASADVDDDGDIDLLSASDGDDKIAWYENDGSGNFTEHVVSTNADGANSVSSADVDGDGDIDLLSASAGDDKIAWYENDGNGNFTEHVVSTDANGARSVASADIDRDGDIDLLSASVIDDKIAWFENDGSGNFTEHFVSTNAYGAFSATSADVDGDIDLLSASLFDDKIAWYENDGNGNFTEHVVSTDAGGAISISSADVDGDGDIDLLSASFNDDKIAWYENIQPNHPPSFQAGSNITVCKNAGGQAIKGWADVTDGDGEYQSLTFTVNNDNPNLFGGLLDVGGQPSVDSEGTLYFRPALDEFGGASMTISLKDGGERTTGGPLGTGEQVFSIFVDPNCDDGAGELFNPGQFDFSFILERVGDIPLDSVNFGSGKSKARAYKAVVSNNSGETKHNVTVKMKLTGQEAVLSADTRCEAVDDHGRYECDLDKLPEGNTEFYFQVKSSGDVTAEAEFTPRAGSQLVPGSSSGDDSSSGSSSSGGGSLGWLGLLGLALFRRKR